MFACVCVFSCCDVLVFVVVQYENCCGFIEFVFPSCWYHCNGKYYGIMRLCVCVCDVKTREKDRIDIAASVLNLLFQVVGIIAMVCDYNIMGLSHSHAHKYLHTRTRTHALSLALSLSHAHTRTL